MPPASLFSKWCDGYMCPVVLTTATPEAERICARNGLLLHELLSAFGHLDNINVSLRSAQSNVIIDDGHIRFERVTEAQAKSPGVVEEILRSKFTEFEIDKLPFDFEDLKVAPPSGWAHEVEQLLVRSGSFCEFEMISQPLLLLTVVSTADEDPLTAMQDLCHMNHAPAGIRSGQYDPDIQRVYLVLHDNTAGLKVDVPSAVLRQMKARFSPTHTRLLCVNSLSDSERNMHQPDIWSRWQVPLYFPQLAPVVEVTETGAAFSASSRGARLSMEDFVSIRNFCVELYQQEIVPAMEKRIAALVRVVNENKKGMKNVFKNFWRKPREETAADKGSVRYRFDRVESQLLLLADMAFAIKDYDSAMSHYKLARDDFRADKSTLHVAYTSMMVAACQIQLDPMFNKGKELFSHLEALAQCLPSLTDTGHLIAFFGVILSEMFTLLPGFKFPVEAAGVMLQCSTATSRLGLICALMTERAAMFCVQAGQNRKYAFHHVIAGNKYFACGGRMQKHAMVCYASALLLHDSGRWSGIKAKLFRVLADEMKVVSLGDGSKRSVILMMGIIRLLTDRECTTSALSLTDSLSVFNELLESNYWTNTFVQESWKQCSVRQILLGDIPVTDCSIFLRQKSGMNDLMKISNGSPMREGKSDSLTVLSNLAVPEIRMPSVCFLESFNGPNDMKPFAKLVPDRVERTRTFTLMEQEWNKALVSGGSSAQSFADAWVKMELSLAMNLTSQKQMKARKCLVISLGEALSMRAEFSNPFPVELQLTDLQLMLNNDTEYDLTGVDLTLAGYETRRITLSLYPKQLGMFEVTGASWRLSQRLQISQPLRRLGPKLQKTLKQRLNGERGVDDSLTFKVVQEYPLLKLNMTGCRKDILHGEVVRVQLTLENVGCADASGIVLKLSLPCIIFETDSINEFTNSHYTSASTGLRTGRPFIALEGSSTVYEFPSSVSIPPGSTMTLHGWLKLDFPGSHKLSITAYYQALRPNGQLEAFGSGNTSRSSCLVVETNVLPSVAFSLNSHSLLSKSEKVVMLDITNELAAATAAKNVPVPAPSLAQTSRSGLRENRSVPSFQAAIEEDIGVTCPAALIESSEDGLLVSVEEEECQVEAVWVLGSAKVLQLSPSSVLSAPNEIDLQPIKSNEVGSVVMKVEVTDPWSQGVVHEDKELSQNLYWGINSSGLLAKEWRQVIERFLCLSDTNMRFQIELEAARAKVRAEQEALAGAAPRSISQVRRDNQSKGGSGPDDGTTLGGTDPRIVFQRSHAGVQWISDQGVVAGEMIVAVAWVCRWKGSIRRGLHITSALPLRRAVPARPSSIASDYVAVHLYHDEVVELKGPEEVTVVKVTLELRSSASVALYSNIEALDSFLLHQHGHHPFKKGTHAPLPVPMKDGVPLAIEPAPQLALKGVRWEGKLIHKNISIAPMGSVSIPFLAVITRPGVYDLRSFNIAVGFAESGGLKESVRGISGQSLVTVQKQ